MEYKIGGTPISDLDVTINYKLSPDDHINDKMRNMCSAANMKAAFKYTDEGIIQILITSFISPSFEYAALA